MDESESEKSQLNKQYLFKTLIFFMLDDELTYLSIILHELYFYYFWSQVSVSM